MTITESYLRKHLAFIRNKRFDVKGIVLHSVGCPQPNASVFVKNWNTPMQNYVCVHAFIDANTGEVMQTLPWNCYCGHVGGRANETHIGIEMCESNYIYYKNNFTVGVYDLVKAKEHCKTAYKSAVELFALLCQTYKLDPLQDGVILSHRECFNRGIGSNHGDPEHYWKALDMVYTMDGFRKDVAKLLGTLNTPDLTETKTHLFDGLELPHLFRITDGALNVRSRPTKYASINTVIRDKGVYTITEISYDNYGQPWGKLKSGAGWICLLYANPVSV